jgi:hypothetical protein
MKRGLINIHYHRVITVTATIAWAGSVQSKDLLLFLYSRQHLCSRGAQIMSTFKVNIQDTK